MTLFMNIWTKMAIVALVSATAGAVIVEMLMSQVIQDLSGTNEQLKVLATGVSAVAELGFLDKGDIESVRKLKENDINIAIAALDLKTAKPQQLQVAQYAQPYVEKMKRYQAEHPSISKPGEAAPPEAATP